MAKINCPKCKTENPADNLFCQSCGTSLKGVFPVSGEKTIAAPRKISSPPPPPAAVSTPPPPAAKAAVPPPTPSIAPPPPPPMPAAQPVYMGTPIQKLGVRVDGWADILTDSASKSEAITNAFVSGIESAKVEGVRVTASDMVSGSGSPRKYQLVYNGKGATAAVKFSPLGNDLFITWDLFTRRKINWVTIGVLGGVVFALGVLNGVLSGIYGGFVSGLMGFINTFLGLLLVPGLGLMLLGKLLKDDVWGLYINDLNDFEADDANALGIMVDNAVMQALEKGVAEAPKASKAKK